MTSFNESFRILCSNVSAALGDLAQHTVVVTSPKADEGKTVTCAKLAASFAARGQRVVIVDLDLRNPGTHLVLGGHNRFGVTDVLYGRRKLAEALQYVKLPRQDGLGERGLFLLAAGPSVVEPNELLSQTRTEQMLNRLAAQADVVLLDSPPVLAVADTLTIGGVAGGAILVVDTRRSNAGAVQRSKDLLERNQAHIVGMVLNQVQSSDASVSASAGYGYGSDRGSNGSGATG